MADKYGLSADERIEAAKARLKARAQTSTKAKKISLRAALMDSSTGLAEVVKSARAREVPWEEIALDLTEELGVPVKSSSLRTYMSEFAPTKPYRGSTAKEEPSTANRAGVAASIAHHIPDPPPMNRHPHELPIPQVSNNQTAQTEMLNAERPVVPRRVR